MGTLVVIAQFFLSLSILVVLHEGGHYLAARMTGTRVEKFYLFFDFLFPFPNKMNFSLFKKKVGDTEYGIGWFPMGGYVSIAGMQDETQDAPEEGYVPKPDEYGAKSKPQKLLIMLGGVIVNFILGFFLYAMVLFVWGKEYLPMSEIKNGIYVDELGEEIGLKDGDKILSIGDYPFERFNPGILRMQLGLEDKKTINIIRGGQEMTLTVPDVVRKKLLTHEAKNYEIFGPLQPFYIDKVVKGSPAEKAGFSVGDQIMAFNDVSTPYFTDFRKQCLDNKGKEVQVGFIPNGEGTNMEYKTVALTDEGTMGVQNRTPDQYFNFASQEYGLMESIPAGINEGWNFIALQFKAFGKMFQGKIKAKDSLGGFGTIGGLFPSTWNWNKFWSITAMLSLILAIMNLLPIPLLDGGYVMFLLFEMITGKEIPEKVMNILMNIGLYLILALMVFANGMDILRALGWA